MKATTKAIFAAAALATAALSSPTPARAQSVELKATSFLPPGNAFLVALEQWADLLKAKSNGRLTMKLFAGGQMGPPPRQFDLVRTGVADIGLILHGSTPGRFPLVELAHLPGLVEGNYSGAVALSSIAEEVFGPDHPGVKVINVLPVKTIIISRNELTSANSLKGKRIRAAGSVQSDALDALGAVPTAVQPGDLNDALNKGMIEGVSIGYTGVDTYKLDDLAKFVAEGDMGAITFSVVMNKATYDKLPPDLRAIVDDNSGLAAGKLYGRVVADEEERAKADLIKRGVKVRELSDNDVLQQAGAKLQDDAIKKASAKGLDARGALDKMKAALAKYAAEN